MRNTTLTWHTDLKRLARCPVCNHEADVPLLLDVNSILVPYLPVSFGVCPSCKSIFQIDFHVPKHETGYSSAIALKFYVEQGAGLETLVLPAFLARQRKTSRYLEIGCGLGFGLDFARRAFGWQVLGIDPSAIAEEGERLLGVKINNTYLTESTRLPGKYDAIAAIEVIEHIASPHRFIDLIRKNLDRDGLLVLTTPNAACVEFGRETPGLLAILTPGSHAIVFNAQSIERVLRDAGFSEVQVVSRGTSILVIAGSGASSIDIDNSFDPAIYRDYLEGRFAEAEPHSILEIGFGYRLFKHLVNSGLLEEAEVVQTRMAAAIKARDHIDIYQPNRIVAELDSGWKYEEFVERMPACLVGLLFFSGIIRLNHHEDRSGAIAYFYAAHAVSGLFRKAMKEFGMDDGETADLELQARKHIRLVLKWMID